MGRFCYEKELNHILLGCVADIVTGFSDAAPFHDRKSKHFCLLGILAGLTTRGVT